MNKIEKFALGSGIIGLVSDLIALTTFIGGLWGTTSTNITQPFVDIPEIKSPTTVREIPLLFSIILILVIVYSWIAISWVLARGSLAARKSVTKDIMTTTMQRTIIGVGILTLPVFTMWLAIMLQSDYPTKIEALNIESTQLAVIKLTPTSTIPTLTPNIKPDGDKTLSSKSSAPVGVWDKEDATIVAIFLSIFLQFVMGFIFFWVLYTLMPVIYHDLADIRRI